MAFIDDRIESLIQGYWDEGVKGSAVAATVPARTVDKNQKLITHKLIKPTFRKHGAFDAQDKVIERNEVEETVTRLETIYTLTEVDDLSVDNDDVLAFFNSLTGWTAEAIDHYFVNALGTVASNAWNPDRGLSTVIDDAASWFAMKDHLNAVYTGTPVAIVDPSKAEVIRAIASEIAGSLNGIRDVADGDVVGGIRVYFRSVFGDVSEAGAEFVKFYVPSAVKMWTKGGIQVVASNPDDSRNMIKNTVLIKASIALAFDADVTGLGRGTSAP